MSSRKETLEPRPSMSPARIAEVEKLVLFIEELSWLLESMPRTSLKRGLMSLRNEVIHRRGNFAGVETFASPNPNKHFLVGVLPRLLTDETLFPTNEDIAQFAESVMKVTIPRFHKKSKYELIGHLVCQTNNLDDRGLSKLVRALSVLVGDDEKIRSLVEKKKQSPNFGWNRIIQELIQEKR